MSEDPKLFNARQIKARIYKQKDSSKKTETNITQTQSVVNPHALVEKGICGPAKNPFH